MRTPKYAHPWQIYTDAVYCITACVCTRMRAYTLILTSRQKPPWPSAGDPFSPLVQAHGDNQLWQSLHRMPGRELVASISAPSA